MSAPAVSIAALKQAIESRDGAALAGFHADRAVIRIIDAEHPPGAPRTIEGRDEIRAYYDDVCGRAMTHRVERGVADDRLIAFTQSCRYPEGARVFCSAMVELEDGRIARQTIVQAWDP